jgi:predicted RNase H-like HicB family nuclease
MNNYVGLIRRDIESDYGASFPDFPGLATAAKTFEEARAMAEEALSFHIDGLIEDSEMVPEPSSLQQIMSDPENRDGVIILVAVFDKRGLTRDGDSAS